MSEDKFENVTIFKKANSYFEGKVNSRNILFSDGTRKTLGFMLPGEYEFSTEDREVMEILSGEIAVQLPLNIEWKTFSSGQSFEVPPKSRFKLTLKVPIDYCCSYG